jgi:hypothetical protein
MKGKERSASTARLPRELPIIEGGRIEITEVGADKELLILGVSRILRFGDDCMCFARRRDEVTVSGSSLSCISYASGAVGIRGKVEGLSFRRREGEH